MQSAKQPLDFALCAASCTRPERLQALRTRQLSLLERDAQIRSFQPVRPLQLAPAHALVAGAVGTCARAPLVKGCLVPVPCAPVGGRRRLGEVRYKRSAGESSDGRSAQSRHLPTLTAKQRNPPSEQNSPARQTRGNTPQPSPNSSLAESKRHGQAATTD